MSGNLEIRARALAERVAQRLETPSARDAEATTQDIAELRTSLREVLTRLTAIESRLPSVSSPPDAPHHAPPAPRNDAPSHAFTPITVGNWPLYAQPLPAHPSQERLNIGSDVTELVDYFENIKRCDFEAGDKPCDNCAMCTARGF